MVNFANRYREAADEWQLYDNTNPLDRRPVARCVRSAIEVVDAERWARFE